MLAQNSKLRRSNSLTLLLYYVRVPTELPWLADRSLLIPRECRLEPELVLIARSNARRLGCVSSIRDRDEVCLTPCTTAAAFEVGPLFDRKRHMVDVAFNFR